MALFDNKYEKYVNDYVEKYLRDNKLYLETFSDPGAMLTTTATIAKYDLQKALKELGCDDTQKYLNMFSSKVDEIINGAKKDKKSQKKLYDKYLAKRIKFFHLLHLHLIRESTCLKW